jgi:cobalt-zinc-cadmium efflux system outer membrane protein
VRLGAVLILGALSACATVSKERGHQEVSALVEERSGHRTGWAEGPPEEPQVQAWVEKALQRRLTSDGAVEIALVNNPSLQETYEELGVSQADMVQAGLLKNPSFSMQLGFPLDPGTLQEQEFALVQDFLDLFVLPLRKEIAHEQFVADTLKVAHQALAVAAQVRKAYAGVQAAEKRVELFREVVQSANAATDLAKRQRAAGNITELAFAAERAEQEQAKLDLAEEEHALLEHREELNRLLGLWGAQVSWKLAQPLAELPTAEADLEQLESRAVKHRLDIEAARMHVQLMEKAVSLARSTRFFGTIEVGIDTHRDPDGPRVLGPSLSLELPIFDQRQAMIARLEAEQRKSERRLRGLSIDARSEIRVARGKLLLARGVVEHYRKVLLPLKDAVVAQSQLQYNAMNLGPGELLASRREQAEAHAGYIEALKRYWEARADLEQQVGGRVAPPSAKEKQP